MRCRKRRRFHEEKKGKTCASERARMSESARANDGEAHYATMESQRVDVKDADDDDNDEDKEDKDEREQAGRK